MTQTTSSNVAQIESGRKQARPGLGSRTHLTARLMDWVWLPWAYLIRKRESTLSTSVAVAARRHSISVVEWGPQVRLLASIFPSLCLKWRDADRARHRIFEHPSDYLTPSRTISGIDVLTQLSPASGDVFQQSCGCVCEYSQVVETQ